MWEFFHARNKSKQGPLNHRPSNIVTAAFYIRINGVYDVYMLQSAFASVIYNWVTGVNSKVFEHNINLLRRSIQG